ncbi:MAG: hypothetical protein JJ900_13265 [Rhodospirillales bacterium]|nr:hypothetical protein [Rhodospirillales bacterium]MBO6787814.1 hypothetical protein [Rhodospirillales bacterium]
MKQLKPHEWSSTDAKRKHIFILAVGVAVATLLAFRPAYPDTDGMVGVYGGLFSHGTKGRANVLASPELAEVLETASDGDMRNITLSSPDAENGIVTYHVRPKSTFQVGERDCRTLTIRASMDAATSETFRIACKRKDGTWHIGTTPPAGNDS